MPCRNEELQADKMCLLLQGVTATGTRISCLVPHSSLVALDGFRDLVQGPYEDAIADPALLIMQYIGQKEKPCKLQYAREGRVKPHQDRKLLRLQPSNRRTLLALEAKWYDRLYSVWW